MAWRIASAIAGIGADAKGAGIADAVVLIANIGETELQVVCTRPAAGSQRRKDLVARRIEGAVSVTVADWRPVVGAVVLPFRKDQAR